MKNICLMRLKTVRALTTIHNGTSPNKILNLLYSIKKIMKLFQPKKWEMNNQKKIKRTLKRKKETTGRKNNNLWHKKVLQQEIFSIS